MDLNGVERIQLNALGGADTITVNDLTGTDVTRVALDLSAPTAAPATTPSSEVRAPIFCSAATATTL